MAGKPDAKSQKPEQPSGDARERKQGKFHYNPVNMSGKEAGIVEEIEKELEGDKSTSHESAERSSSKPDRKP